MNTDGITVRTNIVRSHTLYISRDVMSDLRALAMSQADEPLLAQPDAIGDAILRQHLDAIPELRERDKAIREFFKQLPPLKGRILLSMDRHSS